MVAISETWKFNENIGKTWKFEGYYYGADTSHLGKKGVVYVLIKDIQEIETGDVFRDHTHIEVSQSMYDRYFKDAEDKQKVEFTAKTYHYRKGFTNRHPYVRHAVGLTGMGEVRIKQKEIVMHENKFPKDMKIKTIGWLLLRIDEEDYNVKEYNYSDLTNNKQVRRLTVDVVNTLLKHRGQEKGYHVYEFDSGESSYKAILSKVYLDYRLLNNKDKKFPNYKEVTYKTVEDAYNSMHELRRGRMVLTVIHKATGEIENVHRVKANNRREYKEVLNIIMKYFKVNVPRDYLEGVSFEKVNSEEEYFYPPIPKSIRR